MRKNTPHSMVKKKKSKLWDFNALKKEQKEKVSKAVTNAKGKIDIWVHPFFFSGDRISLQSDYLPKLHEYLRKQRSKKNPKPIVVFIEKEYYESTKELFKGFGIKSPVLFIKTRFHTPFPTLNKNQRKRIRQQVNKLNQSMFLSYKSRNLLKFEKEDKILKHIIRSLEKFGVKEAKLFGELGTSASDDRGCVEGLKAMITLAQLEMKKTTPQEQILIKVDPKKTYYKNDSEKDLEKRTTNMSDMIKSTKKYNLEQLRSVWKNIQMNERFKKIEKRSSKKSKDVLK